MHIHEFAFRSIQGASMPLERWKGQPILIVNTASESQFAPQLRGLQKLHQEFTPSGLVVIGVPCNEYGEKEPLDGLDIDTFYWENHGVNFPVTEKQEIKGRYAHPLFVEMREEFTNEIMPQGNFYKYLFSRDGDLLQHWESDIEPDDSGLRHQIERNASSWCL
jgi:glutathione peroxidase